MSQKHNENYRADIDGLRALAVIAVLIFHAFPAVVPGGFLGVDVFFVISGYLISGIILRGCNDHSFSFSHFYIQRIKRIFPSLLLVLVACCIFGWLFLIPKEFRQLGGHVVAGATFISNFALLRESGYFDGNSEFKMLLHLWSLAIEEQFYIFFPGVLWLFRKKPGAPLKIVCAVGISSFAYASYIGRMHPVEAFYLPWARTWELMAGSLLAVMNTRPGSSFRLGSRGRDFLSCIGLLLICLAYFTATKVSQAEGGFYVTRYRVLLISGIPAVLGAMCFIAAGRQAFFNRYLLSSRGMVWFGLISYSLYLWHWPLLSAAKILLIESPTVNAALLCLSVVLAYLSTKFIERSIRASSVGSRPAKFLVSGMVIVAIGGASVYIAEGFPSRLPSAVSQVIGKDVDIAKDWRRRECFLVEEDGVSTFSASCVEAGSAPLVVLWGDSHAAALYSGFSALHHVENFKLAQLTTSGCAPLITPSHALCSLKNKENLAFISKSKPAVVVLHANWSNFRPTLSELNSVIREIKAVSDARIVVVGPVPYWKRDLPTLIFLSSRLSGVDVFTERMHYGEDKKVEETEAFVKKITVSNGAIFVSALDNMCTTAGCLIHIGGDPSNLTTFDYGHLSPAASKYLLAKIAPSIFPK